MIKRFLCLLFILQVFVLLSDEIQSVTPENIAYDQCKVFVGSQEQEATRKDILAVLGYNKGKGWLGSQTALEKSTTISYLLVFKEALPVGSVVCRSSEELKALKPEAKTIDVNQAADWQKITFTQPESGDLKAALFDTDFKTRALLFILKTKNKYSERGMTYIRIYRDRLANITPYAVANAKEEFTQFHQFSPPSHYFAENLINGQSRWQNTGSNHGEKITRPPVSDFNPSYIILSWPEKHEITGFYINSNVAKFNIYTFSGNDNINPAVGSDHEWAKLRKYQTCDIFGHPVSRLSENKDNVFKNSSSFETIVLFDKPIKTRGIKLLLTSVEALTHYETPQIIAMSSFKVFADIGKKNIKDFADDSAKAPPFQLDINIPQQGLATMVVNDSSGKRVSNLFARKQTEKGKNSLHWDLKDLDGHVITPGTYTITGILSEPLKLQYKMTCYPNVTTNHPGTNTPWRNGHSGAGGWLSDHGAPNSVCTYGDRLYFGAPLSESGECLIACDLTGKRLWGHGNFASWAGPNYLTANSKQVFFPTRLQAGASPSSFVEEIYTVKHDGFKTEQWVVLKDSSTRKRSISGMACDEDKLYVAVNAKPNYFTNAVVANDVDLDKCLPLYKKRDKKRSNHHDVEDQRTEFLRLFRIQGTPPGQGKVLKRLESTSFPALVQDILLIFKHPVPIGSLAFPFPKGDFKFTISYLKNNASAPISANNENQWVEFYRGSGKGWNVLPLPENIETKGLRLRFDKRSELDVELSKTSDGGSEDVLSLDTDEGSKHPNWQGFLDGMKILRRRFKSLNKGMTIKTNSGSINKGDEWYAKRKTPISESDPGIYVMEWEKPQTIRGLAIKEIDAKLTQVDYYTGPATGPINIASSKNWQHIANYTQQRRYYYQPDVNRNHEAIYIDGYVDFGEDVKTRAVRLRLVEQWTTRGTGRDALYGMREDRGGMDLDPTRCRVYGVTAVQYLAGEKPVDPMIYQRLEIYDIASRKLLDEIPLENPGRILKIADNTLLAISNKDVYKIDLKTKQKKLFTSDTINPHGMAVDKNGNLYVYDGDKSRMNIQVYDQNGKRVRIIGKPGGLIVGPWYPERINILPGNIVDIAIDKNDHLWVVEKHAVPKRISKWTTGGKFLQDFLGNTPYGGGGCLDPYNVNKLYYAASYGSVCGTLEFELDWKTRKTKLNRILYLGKDRGGEYPIKANGNLYLVTRPMFARQSSGVVYLYKDNLLKPVAAVGHATSFKMLKTPEIEASLGNKVLNDMEFHWSDLNADGKAQANEVKFYKINPDTRPSVSWFDNNLGIQGQKGRYEVKKFLANGVPVYHYVETPQFPAAPGLKTIDNKFIFWDSSNHETNEVGYTPDGKDIWKYPNGGYGVHALSKAGPLCGEQVVSEFDIIGMAQANQPEMGVFFVTNSNIGRWNVWTSDGILASEVMVDRRDPRAVSWTMPKYEYDMDMTNLTPGSEHFSGYFTKSTDGRYFLVAGHNHISVLEILGMDDMKRIKQSFTVTIDDIRKTQEWLKNQKAKALYKEAKVITCNEKKSTIVVDGYNNDWEEPIATCDNQSFYMVFDDKNIYICFVTQNMGPFKNQGNDWRRLFKTGACVDLQIATNPTADAARGEGIVQGDVRLLISMMDGKPIAVLYQPVDPDAKESDGWETHTMVYKTAFDNVKVLKDIKIAHSKTDDGYIVEATIPFKSLNLSVKPGMRLKMDWGILKTNPEGTSVLERLYWANKNTAIISDEAAEAAITPELWGYVNFAGKKKALLDNSSSVDLLGKSHESNQQNEDELLDELIGE